MQPHVTGLFRHTVVWAALKVILFQCSKNIGLAFMEELCALDSILDGAQWRAGLRDKTATKGMPIGAIAFAVTLVGLKLRINHGFSYYFCLLRFAGLLRKCIGVSAARACSSKNSSFVRFGSAISVSLLDCRISVSFAWTYFVRPSR